MHRNNTKRCQVHNFIQISFYNSVDSVCIHNESVLSSCWSIRSPIGTTKLHHEFKEGMEGFRLIGRGYPTGEISSSATWGATKWFWNVAKALSHLQSVGCPGGHGQRIVPSDYRDAGLTSSRHFAQIHQEKPLLYRKSLASAKNDWFLTRILRREK